MRFDLKQHQLIPLTVIEDSDGVVKGHGLDVERSKDCLLVRQGRVVVGGHLSVEDLLVLIHKEWLQMIIG